jgi:hypothetical protein
MPAFISYSQKDEAAYTTLSVALEGQKIDYWDPKTMRVGASLREQLREGIKKCDVCIFLATHNSIASQWCLAEIGAFWGAGRTVIVFMADSSLSENEIPVQFKGDLWSRDIRKVIDTVRAETTAANERRKARSSNKPKLVSAMSVDMLYDLISSIQVSANRTVSEAMILLRETFSDNEADSAAFALPLVNTLVGVPAEILQSAAIRYWKYTFTLTTDTAQWLGFSNSMINATTVDGYNKCLLVRFDGKFCVAALTLSAIWDRGGDVFGYGDIIASAGLATLGHPISLKDGNAAI